MAPASRALGLGDRYGHVDGEVLLTGLQALVRLPIEQARADLRAGRNTSGFISGYEGSPLAGYDLELTRQRALLAEHRIVFRPNVNEELAVNAVQGSQLAATLPDRTCDGVVGIWYGKAPGLDRATDAVRHANIGGASPAGGVVCLVGDDAIAKSSTMPSSSEQAMAEIGLVVLSPADPQEALDLGLHAVAVSRFCGLWSGMKIATNVADALGIVRVAPDRVTPREPERLVDGREYRHRVSASFLGAELAELERSAATIRPELARRYARANDLNRIVGDPSARLGVVCAGMTSRDVAQALQRLGISRDALPTSGVRLLQLGMLHPLDRQIVERFAHGLREILVVEEKRAFLELAVKDALYGKTDAPAVHGKRGPDGEELFRPYADLPPDLIAGVLARRLTAHGIAVPRDPAAPQPAPKPWSPDSPGPGQRLTLPVAGRAPYFCSGCPHNSSTRVPEGTRVGAGIGCHTLSTLMPADHVGEILGLCQMGGEGAMWIGIEPFVTSRHLVQNLGDGTFHHSGSLAVRAAIAAGSNITYKLLYNSAVAMTGGQQAVGAMAVPQLAAALLAEGVSRIVVTTEAPGRYRDVTLPDAVAVRPRDDLVAVQRELAAVPGVTVLIHDQACATEVRRRRTRGLLPPPAARVVINERVCEGCGDCGAVSNCLSVHPVETEFGRKTRIHQDSCTADLSCLAGDCPSFVLVRPGPGPSDPGADAHSGGEGDDDVPEPVVRVRDVDYGVRITGIGGTGVVTASQVLATAAALAGFEVFGVDQTGLAQKGGAVVSDLRLSREPLTGANKLGPGECDLYLATDLLVAATEAHLVGCDPLRTLAVISTSPVPTGAMVADASQRFPDPGAVADLVASRTRATDALRLDARDLASSALGTDRVANLLLVGVAVQAGAVPVAPAHIERAITLNGVDVERNIAAFRLGRRHALGRATSPPSTPERTPERSGDAVVPASGEQDPPLAGGPDPAVRGGVEIARRVAAPAGSPLAALVQRRVADLIDYQDRRYARHYADTVEVVRAREAAAMGDHAGPIAEAVARWLYKLMAYKDEYEVARLSIDPAFHADLARRFGPEARYAFQLQPPALRALGLRRKISLGPWARPLLAGLSRARRLRGTPVDPFRGTEVRRVERELAGEYRGAVLAAMRQLTPATASEVAALAGLPDQVRGYEDIKLASVARYRAALAQALAHLQSTGTGDAAAGAAGSRGRPSLRPPGGDL